MPTSVNQTFGGQTLTLPAGRFVRIQILAATLDIQGTVLTGSMSVEQATICTLTTTCTTAQLKTVTKIGLAGVSATLPGQDPMVNISGAIVLLPAGFGPGGTGAKGIAGVLQADFAISGGGVSVSAKPGVKINTTGIAVDQTVTVGTTQIRIQAAATPTFQVQLADIKIVIGDFLSIEGTISFGGDSFTGTGLLLFVGSGPYRLADGSVNPDATGLLISNAAIDLRKFTSGATTGYAIAATGDLSILGIPGLNLTVTGLYLRLNTTGQTYTAATTAAGRAPLMIPGTSTPIEFTTSDVVLDFGAQMIRFEIGGLIQISGGVRFSKRPNGTIDISLAGATIALDLEAHGDFTTPDISLSGSANFSIGGPEGFKLQSFKVNGFSLFGSGGAPATTTPPKFQPTADLKAPFAGAVICAAAVQHPGLHRHPVQRSQQRRHRRAQHHRCGCRVRPSDQRPSGLDVRHHRQRRRRARARPQERLPLRDHRRHPRGR